MNSKIRNHERIHSCAILLRRTYTDMDASDLFLMACGLCGAGRRRRV